MNRPAARALWIMLGCLLLMGAVYAVTAKRIAQQQAAAAEALLLEVIAPSRYDNTLLEASLPLLAEEAAQLNEPTGTPAYVASRQSVPVAVILPVSSAEGYGGRIELLVGIYCDGRIAGVRVRSHQETPGMGNKIEIQHSPWILNFNGKSLQLPYPEGWRVKADGGEFDQLAGATITPRAVVKAVKLAQQFFAAEQARLLARFQATHPPAAPRAP